MHHLKILNRRARFFSTTSLKGKWKNLSHYLTDEMDSLCWKEVNNKSAEIEKIIEQNVEEESMAEVKKIEWNKWMNKIGNREVLSCMKNYYDKQMEMLESMEMVEKKELNEEKKSKDDSGEVRGLFDKALGNCKSAEKESERLLINGAKTLWIMFHNPAVEHVDNNEWIESDRYWKAFVEKHAVYNLNNKSLEPEDEENKNTLKNEWQKKTTTFNERSDTPILYDYMINLPHWEYYDINRRVFLEHLCYFLLRTGLKFQMFPELFKWKWMTHIEDLRFQFLDIAVKRKNELQLATGKREIALELQPIDYEHNGEEYHLKLLRHFKEYQNLILSRLMANCIFLCDPFIPIQTMQNFKDIQKKFTGKLYKLNDDINCLFYLPIEEKEQKKIDNCKPFDALNNFYSYLKQNNIRLNPSYSKLIHILTEILQERGDFWLKAPNETLADAFLRRLDKEDSLYPTFIEYICQMKEQFEKKTEIPLNKYQEEIQKIEKKYIDESQFFQQFIKALLNEEPLLQEQDKLLQWDKLEKMELNQIQRLIDEGDIHAVDSLKNKKITKANQLVDYLKKQEIEKIEIQNYIKGLI